MKKTESMQSSSSAGCALILCSICVGLWFDSNVLIIWFQKAALSDTSSKDQKGSKGNTKIRAVVVSFGVTKNKSKQMSHFHLCKPSGSSSPKGSTESLEATAAEESVRAILSWFHSLFSALLPCKICRRSLFGLMIFLYVSALWLSSSRRRRRLGGRGSWLAIISSQLQRWHVALRWRTRSAG